MALTSCCTKSKFKWISTVTEVFLAFIVAAVISGCSETYQGASFITNGGKKLSGVEIIIVKKEEIGKFPSDVNEEISRRKDIILQNLRQADWNTFADQSDKYRHTYAKTVGLWSDTLWANRSSVFADNIADNKVAPIHKQNNENIKSTCELIRKSFKELKLAELKDDFDQISGTKFYVDYMFNKFKSSTKITTTDPDGKFTAKVRRGKNVLFARTSDKGLAWALEIDEENQEIFLTDKNIIGFNCPGCLIDKIDGELTSPSPLSSIIGLIKTIDADQNACSGFPVAESKLRLIRDLVEDTKKLGFVSGQK